MAASKKRWYAYILRCADGSLYSGVTTDLERRVREHNGEGPRGARYTRPRRPVSLAYSERFKTRSEAGKRESALKSLTRSSKLALIRRKS